MSDTYNYNAGSPFGGMGGMFGGCGYGGFGGCNSIMDLLALVVVGGLFGFGGWGGGFGGFGGRGMMPGMGGGGDIPAVTASLVGQQQVADRVASINTGVDAIAGLVTAQGTKLETVKDAVVNGFYANQTQQCQMANNFTQQLNDMRFAQQQCCCETRGLIESKFCNLTHQIERDKSETLAAVRAEGDATRALLRDMETAQLREKLAKAEAQISQDNQTSKLAALIQAQCGRSYNNSNCGCDPCGCQPNACNILAKEIIETGVNRIVNPTTTATAS